MTGRAGSMIRVMMQSCKAMGKPRTGRYIYAVGSHNDNAYDSGINTAKIQTIAYLINALRRTCPALRR